MAIETAELCGSGLGSDGPERVGKLLSTSGSFISFPDSMSAISKISGIISNGRNQFVVFVEKTCIIYRADEAGTIEQASAISIGEKVDHATWLSLESFGFVTMSGKIVKMNISSTELPTPASSYIPEIRFIARVDSHSILIVQDAKNVTLFDFETALKTDLSLENLPIELELPDMRIDGVCQLSTVSDFSIIATSEDGMNVVFLTVCLEDNKLNCKEASMNEIFLSGSEGAPLGVMQYVEQFSLLIGGHSYSDAAALFRQSQDKETTCMLLPEGKQLTCSVIDGDTSKSFLTGMCALVLKKNPIKVPRNQDLVDCNLVIITIQMDGWCTFHYGELPDDWFIQEPKLLTHEPSVDKTIATTGIESFPSELEAETTPNTEKIETKPFLEMNPSVIALKPELKPLESAPLPTGTAPSPGLFDSKIQAPRATIPGLFDSSIKPHAPTPGLFNTDVDLPKAVAPGLFDSKVDVSKPAAPGLFDSKVDIPKALAPGLFDSKVAAPKAATPGLFDSKIEAPKAAAPGLFDSKVTAPKITAPGLFNANVQAPSTTSLFGQSPSASGSLFGSFGQTLESKSTSAFGSFGQPAIGTSGFGQSSFGQSALKPIDQKTILNEPKTASISTGLFGKPSEPAKDTAPSTGGLFGQPATAPSTGGLFGQKTEPMFGQSGIGKPASESTTTAGLFDQTTKSTIPGSPLKPVPSTIVKPSSPLSKPKATGLSISEALIDGIEKELKQLESKRGELSKQVPTIKLQLPVTPNISLDDHKKTLLTLREEVRKHDGDIRSIYAQGPSSSDDIVRMADKCQAMSTEIESLSTKVRKVSRRSRPNSTRPSYTEPPQLVLPQTPTTANVPIFRPLPPSLRRETHAGLGIITPIKASPQSRMSELGIYDSVKRDSVTSRIRQPRTSKRMSLGDLLTGKILSSPEAKSRSVTPELVAPTLDAPTGGHGAAWQLLRIIEQQNRELENMSRQIDAMIEK